MARWMSSDSRNQVSKLPPSNMGVGGDGADDLAAMTYFLMPAKYVTAVLPVWLVQSTSGVALLTSPGTHTAAVPCRAVPACENSH